MGVKAGGAERKTALVSGASSGIGREVARQFSDLGWRVIAVALVHAAGIVPTGKAEKATPEVILLVRDWRLD